LRARLHFGGSFLCLLGTCIFECRRKEPPPQLTRSTTSGTSPVIARISIKHVLLAAMSDLLGFWKG
ncbi:hypothetical protein, partial [Methylibium sp.]|uniref:hypothetical protein n=1 Tax=Methylibium sp. TaxID=2067992 RepID=UPI0025CB8B8A